MMRAFVLGALFFAVWLIFFSVLIQHKSSQNRATLNEAANAAIKADVTQHGYVLLRTTIVRENVQGDTGTVTADVFYGRTANSKPIGTEVTLIFHRTEWSLTTVTIAGLPA